MAGATFIRMIRATCPTSSAAALKFFDWTYGHGSKVATALDYVPMPQSAVALIERVWAEKIKTGDGAPVFKR